MSQRKAWVEEQVETVEDALALLGRARRLAEISAMKADLTNEPIRSSLLDDIDEQAWVLKRVQDKVSRFKLWIDRIEEGKRKAHDDRME